MLPDFLIIGVPKAGTTALHVALASHPQLLLSKVKEPKYFLCDERPPAREYGPGDAHSLKEWIWRRDRYEALFDGPSHLLRGESTPFYLYDIAAHRRIAAAIPRVKLIVVLRDPVDRAHSNWLHLLADGLEPVGDFLTACELEDDRIQAGWGAFWHYRRLGLYGGQLERLFETFLPEQVHILRYRQLVEEPIRTLDEICVFLGVRTGLLRAAPERNTRGFVDWSSKSLLLRSALVTGAAVGAWFPPQVWRKVSIPLLWASQRGSGLRPKVSTEQRQKLIEYFAQDIKRLEAALGRDFSDWLGDWGGGEYRHRTRRPEKAKHETHGSSYE